MVDRLIVGSFTLFGLAIVVGALTAAAVNLGAVAYAVPIFFLVAYFTGGVVNALTNRDIHS